MESLLSGAIIGLVYISHGRHFLQELLPQEARRPAEVVNGGAALYVTPAYYLAWVWPLVFIRTKP